MLNIRSTEAEVAGTPNTFLANVAKFGHLISNFEIRWQNELNIPNINKLISCH